MNTFSSRSHNYWRISQGFSWSEGRSVQPSEPEKLSALRSPGQWEEAPLSLWSPALWRGGHLLRLRLTTILSDDELHWHLLHHLSQTGREES